MVRYVNYIVIFHCSILTNIHSADTDFKYYNLFMWKREEFCRRHGQRQPRRSYCKESFFKVCNLGHLSIFLDKLKFKDKTTKLYFNSIQIWGKIISIVDLHEVKFCFVRNKFASNWKKYANGHLSARYLYSELKEAHSGRKSEIFTSADSTHSKCQLKPGVKFHLFSSHTPCKYLMDETWGFIWSCCMYSLTFVQFMWHCILLEWWKWLHFIWSCQFMYLVCLHNLNSVSQKHR